MKSSHFQTVVWMCFVIATVFQSNVLGDVFILDGVTYQSTPTIISQSTIASTANPGQDISNGQLLDVYFNTSSQQFVLGIRSTSFDEVVFFDSPASGAGYTVNASGATIASSSSISLTESVDGDVIVGNTPSLGDFHEMSPYGTSFSADFTAPAATLVSRGTRGKLDKGTDLFFSITGSSFVGVGDDGIVVYALSDTSMNGDYDSATAGTQLAIDDYGNSNGDPPGLAILSTGDLLVTDIHSAAFQQYDYSGLNVGDADFGLETGSFTVSGPAGNWNSLIGLTGVSQLTGVSALTLGTNAAGQRILMLVDRGGTFADGTDDRVYFFASVPEPSSALILIMTSIAMCCTRRLRK